MSLNCYKNNNGITNGKLGVPGSQLWTPKPKMGRQATQVDLKQLLLQCLSCVCTAQAFGRRNTLPCVNTAWLIWRVAAFTWSLFFVRLNLPIQSRGNSRCKNITSVFCLHVTKKVTRDCRMCLELILKKQTKKSINKSDKSVLIMESTLRCIVKIDIKPSKFWTGGCEECC